MQYAVGAGLVVGGDVPQVQHDLVHSLPIAPSGVILPQYVSCLGVLPANQIQARSNLKSSKNRKNGLSSNSFVGTQLIDGDKVGLIDGGVVGQRLHDFKHAAPITTPSLLVM